MRDILKDQKLLRRVEWCNAIITVLVVLGTGVVFSWQMGGGVLVGAVIMTANLYALKWQVTKALNQPGSLPSKGALFIKYYLRFLAVFFLVFTVIYYGWVNLIGFLVGLSLVMVSIVFVGFEEFVIMLLKGDR